MDKRIITSQRDTLSRTQEYTQEEIIMEIHGEKDSPNKGLLVVSDGSVKVNDMEHGWVIANYDSEKIVCGAATAQGKGSSLRDAGYGMSRRYSFMILVGVYTYTNPQDICICLQNI